jgi:poly-gamma-glutamate system protein
MDHGVGRSSPVFAWFLALSLAFLILIQVLPFAGSGGLHTSMVEASEMMASAAQALHECRTGRGIAIDPETDINRTGLIGLEFSSITTSVGRLEAKRTTTDPNAAGLVVLLLHEAGVRRGDTIAVGASGSFPALIAATLCAASALDVNALLLPSLGASQWGANHPEFHWLNMQDCLEEQGFIPRPPVAVSLGGDSDVGISMAPEGRALLEDAMEASGLSVIREPDLEKNVALRMRLFEEAAGGSDIRAFVNIGGTFANMGTDSRILEVKPGVARIRSLPPPERRGMVFAMAARGIPVIHLLYIRGLASEYGLPWDPAPLPSPGEGPLYRRVRERSLTFLILGLVYLAAVIALLLIDIQQRKRRATLGGY